MSKSKRGPGPLRLSAVLPVYNERDALPALTEELVAELDQVGVPYEVLLVDDGSNDGSGHVIDALAARHPRVRALHLDQNHGQSAALSAGFRAARGEYILTLDADGQNDPADISRMMEWIPQADMVAGYRQVRKDSWVRRASSRVANRVRNKILGDGIADTGCSLKLFRRDLTASIPPLNGMHRFLPVFVQLQGGQVRQLPVNHRPRSAGTSKYGLNDRLRRGMLDLAGMWWFRRRYLRYRVSTETAAVARPSRIPSRDRR